MAAQGNSLGTMFHNYLRPWRDGLNPIYTVRSTPRDAIEEVGGMVWIALSGLGWFVAPVSRGDAPGCG